MKNRLKIGVLLLFSATTILAQQTPIGNLNEKSRITLVLNAFSFNKPLLSGEMSIFDVIDYAASVGFEGIDLPCYYVKSYPIAPSDDFIFSLKQRAFKRGIPICGIGIKNNFAWADPAQRIKEKQFVKDWVVVAAKLGVSTLRIFTGLAIPKGYTWEQTADWIAADIDECAQFAKNYGIVLAIFNHNDFLKTADEIDRLFAKIKSDNVGLMLDIGSFSTGDPYKQIEQSIKYAVTWQLKEKVITDHVASPTDIARVLQIIKKNGYCGPIPMESVGQDNHKERVKEALLRVQKARNEVFMSK